MGPLRTQDLEPDCRCSNFRSGENWGKSLISLAPVFSSLKKGNNNASCIVLLMIQWDQAHKDLSRVLGLQYMFEKYYIAPPSSLLLH